MWFMGQTFVEGSLLGVIMVGTTCANVACGIAQALPAIQLKRIKVQE